MKRTIIGVAVIAVLALAYFNFTQPEPGHTITGTAMKMEVPKTKAKPICSSAQVPAGDCIPQYLANLPPDPGEAGKATIAGIDSANRGYRDDVHIWLVQTWGHSPRAMALLTIVAKSFQQQVVLGNDTISAEEAHKMFDQLMSITVCHGRGETPEMLQAQAKEWLKVKTLNTPERFLRYWDFSNLFGHHAFAVKDETVIEACGFDPEALPN